ncbi:hypothetical protein NDU88_002618 [Pleurodeles waltl]|uniref:Uncharacterized protein n=1 Tax=Pleurodeles waltl TaxID=8319 RepID=A0AAV7VDT5_PLEWA|nr:hypothetical protein NDU88_002618 [Pleurodeles waltl]
MSAPGALQRVTLVPRRTPTRKKRVVAARRKERRKTQKMPTQEDGENGRQDPKDMDASGETETADIGRTEESGVESVEAKKGSGNGLPSQSRTDKQGR